MRKIILPLLCFSVLFSCNYYEAHKRKEQEAIQRQKVIEAKEAKMQDMKNNIAKYVYLKEELYLTYIFNDTDYTIDKVIIEYIEKGGYNAFTNMHMPDVKKNLEYSYIAAHTKVQAKTDCKIISIKSQALGIK